jgi:uncharacterized protein DUF5666
MRVTREVRMLGVGWRAVCIGSVILTLSVLSGCSGYSQSATQGLSLGRSATGIDPNNEGSLQLRIGDDPTTPAGRIVALRLDIATMRFRNSTTGDSISFLGDPVSVELTHSSTVTVPIAQSGANPDTTYDLLDIAYTGSAISYMNVPSMLIYNQELGPLPDQTVPLSPPVSLGTEPLVLNVQIDVSSIAEIPPIMTPLGAPVAGSRQAPWRTVVLPPVVRTGRKQSTVKAMATSLTGNSPAVTVSQSLIQQNEQQPQSGQIQHLVGVCTKVGVNSITLKVNGSSFAFQTDANTDFENVTLGTSLNSILEVSGATQADGSLHADEVELVDVANGVELTGLVTSVYPDTELSMVVHDGIGAGMYGALIGKTITSQLDLASFTVAKGTVDMTGVTAVFDGEHIFPGQQVEVETFTSLQPDPFGNSALAVPFMVELEQQTISGIAVNYVSQGAGTGTFDLNLPQDGTSPLANLNPGLISVHIVQNATTFPILSSIRSNAKAQVRGFLLCENDNLNQPCTNFLMVASRITVND